MLTERIMFFLEKEMHNEIVIKEIINYLLGAHVLKEDPIVRVKMLLKSNLPDDAKRENIARKMYMSERSFSRLLRRHGFNFQQLLDETRQDLCTELMQNGIDNAYCLSDRLGFSDSTYFYRTFKKWNGMSFKEAKSNFGRIL